MDPQQRLFEVFDRGFQDRGATLSSKDRDLFRIQEFIIDYEMSGLSGLLYNWFHDRQRLGLAIEAMRRFGLIDLASLVNEAANVLPHDANDEDLKCWSDVLERHDPANRLVELDHRIAALNDYGLKQSSID